MAFDGSGDGKAQLKAWAEAEYHWAFTSIEGNAKREAWIAEIKQIFDLNPYVQYLPSAITGNPDDDNQAGEGGNGQSPTKPNGEIESC